jgi:2,3-bisphosphoglycerate-dependent phosphoglycerate mutase
MSVHETPQVVQSPTRVVLIRHGESNVTVRRVIGGHRSCDGLSPLGAEQALRLANRFERSAEIRPDVLISSNFARAIQTAELIAPALGAVELEIVAELGEHDPGPDLDGVSFRDYVDRFGTPDWGGDPHADVFPGGETTAQFHLRVGAAMAKLLGERSGSTIVIVCHGGVIDAVFRQLLHVSSTGGFELQATNTSITEFVSVPATAVRPATWRLVRYDDAAHLAGLAEFTPRNDD